MTFDTEPMIVATPLTGSTTIEPLPPADDWSTSWSDNLYDDWAEPAWGFESHESALAEWDSGWGGTQRDSSTTSFDTVRRPRTELTAIEPIRLARPLLSTAEKAHQAGDALCAVMALHLAVEEHPASSATYAHAALGEKTLHDIYLAFLGDLGAIPVVAPGHQGSCPQCSRTAFLLSRIDGIMSIDELLDISGMSRLEASYHLSVLILRQQVRLTR